MYDFNSQYVCDKCPPDAERRYSKTSTACTPAFEESRGASVAVVFISKLTMCQQDFDERVFHYVRQTPRGIPADFPNRDEVFVLKDLFHSRGGPFQRLLDCGGIHYVLLLEFNNDHADCMENALLEKMYQAFEEKDLHRCRNILGSSSEECMQSFWPYLQRDLQMRRENGTLMDPITDLDYDREDCHTLQLKTVDGSVRAMEHDKLVEKSIDRFDNPYSDLRCFSQKQVEMLEKISNTAFRVRIQDEQYCLKAPCLNVLNAIEKSRALPPHPNVVGFTGAYVDARGKILGLVMPFIAGVRLSRIESATISQKTKWKAKISDAIGFLHKENIAWGDANPYNIMVNSVNDEPVLIDLEGGCTEGWVDADLHDTREGDLQALPRILKFVDDIPTKKD